VAEVLVRFVARIFGSDGTEYVPQACGRIAEDGLWEGWIEFESPSGVVRTARETEQPNRDALLYWAEGLSVAYLEGALARATRPPAVAPVESVLLPHASGPARRTAPRGLRAMRAILDPFSTYAQGEDLLRGQLNALSHDNLVAIIEDYALPVYGTADRPAPALIDAIVESVRTAGRPSQAQPGKTMDAREENRL
jgi:hypothetical protein